MLSTLTKCVILLIKLSLCWVDARELSRYKSRSAFWLLSGRFWNLWRIDYHLRGNFTQVFFFQPQWWIFFPFRDQRDMNAAHTQTLNAALFISGKWLQPERENSSFEVHKGFLCQSTGAVNNFKQLFSAGSALITLPCFISGLSMTNHQAVCQLYNIIVFLPGRGKRHPPLNSIHNGDGCWILFTGRFAWHEYRATWKVTSRANWLRWIEFSAECAIASNHVDQQTIKCVSAADNILWPVCQ